MYLFKVLREEEKRLRSIDIMEHKEDTLTSFITKMGKAIMGEDGYKNQFTQFTDNVDDLNLNELAEDDLIAFLEVKKSDFLPIINDCNSKIDFENLERIINYEIKDENYKSILKKLKDSQEKLQTLKEIVECNSLRELPNAVIRKTPVLASIIQVNSLVFKGSYFKASNVKVESEECLSSLYFRIRDYKTLESNVGKLNNNITKDKWVVYRANDNVQILSKQELKTMLSNK